MFFHPVPPAENTYTVQLIIVFSGSARHPLSARRLLNMQFPHGAGKIMASRADSASNSLYHPELAIILQPDFWNTSPRRVRYVQSAGA
jgi:hypothetical protein